ncbi:MAG: hypothetical protein LBS50_08740 [Prevotellaceae bacterium]|nr:hypothetical protein [Prevotellaceae bacterium]
MKYAIYILSVLLLICCISIGFLWKMYSKTAAHTQAQQVQILELDSALQKALNKTETSIKFSIQPTITNKVTSAFGSTKNVTLQYYFTLDGKAMIVKADSTYQITKEYAK